MLSTALCGCTSTASYYQLNSKLQWSQSGSSCTGPFSQYGRELDSGVRLVISLYRGNDSTDMGLGFFLDKGKTAQLSDDLVIVQTEKLQSRKVVKIGDFISERSLARYNLAAAPHLKQYEVARLVVNSTDVMQGLERFSNLRGDIPGDRYSTIISLADRPIDSMVIELPSLIINGKLFTIDPLHFTYTSSTYLQCIQ